MQILKMPGRPRLLVSRLPQDISDKKSRLEDILRLGGFLVTYPLTIFDAKRRYLRSACLEKD